MKIKYPNIQDVKDIISRKVNSLADPVFTLGELLNSMAMAIVIPDKNAVTEQTSILYSDIAAAPESHFFIRVEQDMDINTIQIAQSIDISSYANRSPIVYNAEEAQVVGEILVHLFQKLINLPSYNDEPCDVQVQIDPWSLVIQGVQEQLFVDNPGYKTIRMKQHRYLNNLTNEKISDEVSNYYLSQEVAEGAPFSIKKSIEHAFGTDDIRFKNSYGVTFNCAWHTLFNNLKLLLQRIHNLPLTSNIDAKLLTQLTEDIDNTIVKLYSSSCAELFLGSVEITNYKNRFNTINQMAGKTFCIMSKDTMGHLNCYQITRILNRDILSFNELLQPSTAQEALEELNDYPPIQCWNTQSANCIQLTSRELSVYDVLYHKL